MSKFTKQQGEKKRQYSKSLYVKGYETETIAEIINVAVSTLKKWNIADDWDTARKSSFIAISELRNTILASFIDLKEGREPKIKPDEAAKYAAAFEKLSDKKKSLGYMYEAYELLTDELTKDIASSTFKKDKENALNVLKTVRDRTDRVLTRIANETLNN